jgi:ABC-type dipeptide/oligopeptide/nickel transport system ATPase component
MLEVKLNSLELKKGTNFSLLFKNINFEVSTNSIYSLVGKNGIGKTTLLNSLLNLLDKKNYRIDGKVLIDGTDPYKCDLANLVYLRNKVVKYIFQDSQSSLDPLKKIFYYFKDYSNSTKLDELLDYFVLPKKEILLNYYPFQLSGGMAQRLAIILGIISQPKLLILDEPNSSLDIPISNLLSNKLIDFSSSNHTSILIVTQDINFALNTSDKISLLTQNGITEFNADRNKITEIKSTLIEALITS